MAAILNFINHIFKQHITLFNYPFKVILEIIYLQNNKIILLNISRENWICFQLSDLFILLLFDFGKNDWFLEVCICYFFFCDIVTTLICRHKLKSGIARFFSTTIEEI